MFALRFDPLVNNLCFFAKIEIKSDLSVFLYSYIKKLSTLV